MTTWNVYKQERPMKRSTSGEFEANMVRCGRVDARNMEEAMVKARAITLHCAIHELDKHGDEVWR